MVLVAYKLNSAIERGTKPDRFCWSQHICAPYLDEPEAAWFGAGRPVVGYFHDRELAPEGVEWMRRWLDWWQNAGAQRLMDFRKLAAAIGRRLYIEERDGALFGDGLGRVILLSSLEDTARGRSL